MQKTSKRSHHTMAPEECGIQIFYLLSPHVDILYSEYNWLGEMIIMIIISRRGDCNGHHSKYFMEKADFGD